MVGDLLTSVAVLVNGLLLLFFPWYWLDPLAVGLYRRFYPQKRVGAAPESTAVLMNATPDDIDLEKVGAFLANYPGVSGVHYLHAWRVSSRSIAFSCHVVVPDQTLSGTERLAGCIRQELLQRFGIDHPVLQLKPLIAGRGPCCVKYPAPAVACAPRGYRPPPIRPPPRPPPGGFSRWYSMSSAC